VRFSHTEALWAQFPELVPLVLHVRGIHARMAVVPAIAPLHERARERLVKQPEGEWPEIQAWRRAFSRLGLKPTQVRCAAESLLRRFRKENDLPRLHPLVDLCNAVSLAYAAGTEVYEDFSGVTEQPEAREVVFADAAGYAHARRWCHRQSARSAVRETTAEVLIVAEAMHAGAAADLQRLAAELTAALADAGTTVLRTEVLRRDRKSFVT
jgi:DNA/RNA-binding domain of Phe-tRNA-synthetase-like protein